MTSSLDKRSKYEWPHKKDQLLIEIYWNLSKSWGDFFVNNKSNANSWNRWDRLIASDAKESADHNVL